MFVQDYCKRAKTIAVGERDCTQLQIQQRQAGFYKTEGISERKISKGDPRAGGFLLKWPNRILFLLLLFYFILLYLQLI